MAHAIVTDEGTICIFRKHTNTLIKGMSLYLLFGMINVLRNVYSYI